MKKPVVRVILMLAAAAMISMPCRAAVDTDSISEALPQDARQYVAVSPSEGDVVAGLKGIVTGAVGLLREDLRAVTAEGFMILSIGALTGILSAVALPLSSDILKKLTGAASVCAVTAICIGSGSNVLSACASSISKLQYFSAALIPVYAAAVAVSGNPVSAVSMSTATLVFSNVLIFAASKILIPIIYFHLLLSVAGQISDNKLLCGSAQLLRKSSIGFFKYFLMLYTAYATMSGLISSCTDAVALKTAKVTISGSVPVLGSVVSDVSEALLSGAAVLKNAVGFYGFIGALAICLVPFVAALMRIMIFRILALITASMCGGELSRLLDSVSDSYNIALGLLGTCCAIQFLSFVICSVVIHK